MTRESSLAIREVTDSHGRKSRINLFCVEREPTLWNLRSFLERVVLDNCIEYFAVEERVKQGEARPEQFRFFFNAVSSLEAALAYAPRAEQFSEGRERFLELLARAEPSLHMVHLVGIALTSSGFGSEDSGLRGPSRGFERELMASTSVSLRAAFEFWLDYKHSLDEELGESRG